MVTHHLTPAHIASRVAASFLGSYGFVWGFTTLGIVLGVMSGLPFTEAQTLMHLLAFVLLVSLFCWAYSCPSLARVWLVLAGGGATMSLAGWWLARTLVNG